MFGRYPSVYTHHCADFLYFIQVKAAVITQSSQHGATIEHLPVWANFFDKCCHIIGAELFSSLKKALTISLDKLSTRTKPSEASSTWTRKLNNEGQEQELCFGDNRHQQDFVLLHNAVELS
jgi:hypothetical protein